MRVISYFPVLMCCNAFVFSYSFLGSQQEQRSSSDINSLKDKIVRVKDISMKHRVGRRLQAITPFSHRTPFNQPPRYFAIQAPVRRTYGNYFQRQTLSSGFQPFLLPPRPFFGNWPAPLFNIFRPQNQRQLDVMPFRQPIMTLHVNAFPSAAFGNPFQLPILNTLPSPALIPSFQGPLINTFQNPALMTMFPSIFIKTTSPRLIPNTTTIVVTPQYQATPALVAEGNHPARPVLVGSNGVPTVNVQGIPPVIATPVEQPHQQGTHFLRPTITMPGFINRPSRPPVSIRPNVPPNLPGITPSVVAQPPQQGTHFLKPTPVAPGTVNQPPRPGVLIRPNVNVSLTKPSVAATPIEGSHQQRVNVSKPTLTTSQPNAGNKTNVTSHSQTPTDIPLSLATCANESSTHSRPKSEFPNVTTTTPYPKIDSNKDVNGNSSFNSTIYSEERTLSVDQSKHNLTGYGDFCNQTTNLTTTEKPDVLPKPDANEKVNVTLNETDIDNSDRSQDGEPSSVVQPGKPIERTNTQTEISTLPTEFIDVPCLNKTGGSHDKPVSLELVESKKKTKPSKMILTITDEEPLFLNEVN